MIRVLYLPTRYFPAISGAEFYLQRMAEILKSKYNYDLEIFTSDAIDFKALRHPAGKKINKADENFAVINNVPINRFPIKYDGNIEEKVELVKKLPSYKLLKLSDNTLRELLNNGPYLEEILVNYLTSDKLNYDIVHTTFYPYFNILIALLIGKTINNPTICTPFFHFSNPRYSNPVLFEILRKFDNLIACTHLEKEFLIEKVGISKEKVKVIPMGVDYEKFDCENNKNLKSYSFKNHYFKNHEKKYKMVLFCGYKNYEKGALSILRAIPQILQKYKKVYFVFIGPSTMAFNRELSKIQKIKNSRIINLTPDNLTGYFDKKKIAAFKETDIYLMPSRSDAFGIAFLEAWASGKPVIGANVGATPEVINNHQDGLLVEFNNDYDISEKVLYLLKKKKLRETLGSNGRLKVFQNFSWEIIAERTHQTYQNLISMER
ncbi:MAG: glycosyltransferase family 4 protein [Candidatus Hodarchaeota archaeon]